RAAAERPAAGEPTGQAAAAALTEALLGPAAAPTAAERSAPQRTTSGPRTAPQGAAAGRAGRAETDARPDRVGAALERSGVPAAEASAWGVAPALRATAALSALEDGAELYEALRLRGALERVAADAGVSDPWAAARLVDVLLRARVTAAWPGSAGGLGAALRQSASQELLGVHVHGGERWFRQERFRLLTAGVVGASSLAGAAADVLERQRADLEGAEEASGYHFDRLLELVDAMATPRRQEGAAAASPRPKHDAPSVQGAPSKKGGTPASETSGREEDEG
ncbi:MAG: hypothetical protein P8Y13_11055, partial [Deinococcales bacterium]